MGYISIIADDLTGASDTGIQFRKYGLKTKVIVEVDELDEFLEGDEILAINSNTRPLKGEKAYKKVYDICCLLKQAGFTRIYKKVDSTFRGNPGIELEAVMDALGSNLAILAPSFPDNGRFMMNGNLKISPVYGEAKDKEAISLTNEGEQDLCHVPTIIQSQMKRKVANIDLKTVQQGIPAILNEIEKLCTQGYQVMVVDAVTKNDLKTIALACKSLPKDTVLAGAAGFAAFLPTVIDFPSKIPQKPPSNEGSILIVAGTYNSTTRKQIEEVLKNTNANLVKIDTYRIINGLAEEEVENIVGKIYELKKTEKANKDLFIIAVDTLFKLKDNIQLIKGKGKAIATAIGDIVGKLVDEQMVQSLVLTGGDTALHVLNSLKAKGIDLEEEILPGIPLGFLVGGKANNIPVITKAGGFGTPTALLEVIQHLQTKEKTRVC